MGRQTMFQVITPSAVSLRLSSNDQEDQELDLSDLPDADDSALDLSDLPDATPQPAPAPINQPGPSAPKFDINTASDLERLAAGLGPKEEQSTLGKAWDWYNKPLSDLPSQAGRKLSQLIDPQRGTTGLRSIASAYVEGLGDVATGMLSPSNLTPIGAGYGAAKTGLSALSKAAKGASGLQAVHGGQEMIRPDATMFERGMGALEAFMGGRGVRQNYLKPPAEIPPPVDSPPLPESFGPQAYAGPERRGSGPRQSSADVVFQEYRDRLARGEDVRSKESKALLEKKTATDTTRKQAKIVERNGKFYEQTGVNPDTNQPTYKEIPRPPQDPFNKAALESTQTPAQRFAALSPDDQRIVSNLVNQGKSAVEAMDSVAANKARIAGQAAPIAPKPPAVLAADLKNAKPRFNMGNVTYVPMFANDIDKALYIIAQKTPSARNADYLKFVMDNLGVDEATAVAMGQQVKARVKEHVKGKSPGSVSIPNLSDDLQQVSGRGPNASGESAASQEALNRQASMKAKGEQYIVYDRAGNARPLIGPDAVDYVPAKGETLVIQGQSGRTIVQANGGKVPRDMPQVGTGPVNPANQSLPPGRVPGIQQLQNPLPPPPNAGNVPITHGPTGPPPNVPLRPAPTGGTPPPPPKGKPISNLANITNVSKTMKSSLDFSAPLRQGLPLIHKKAWWTSLDDMVKAWGSKGAYDRIMADITNDPSGYFKPKIDPVTGKVGKSFAEEMGLDLTDIVNRREETMLSNLADKVPGIERSNRAYVAFLNKLRADTFRSLIDEVAKADPNFRNNTVVSKNLAKFVNNATGRGSLGGMEEAANVLNGLVFSPRLMAANLNRLNPVNYVANSNRGARLEYLKSAIAQATAWTTMAALASEFGGADVSLDPTNSDFGKIKFGNSRMDPSGGIQTYLVALARMTPKAVGKEVKELTGWNDARTGVFTSPGNPRLHQDYGKGFPPRSKFDVGVDFAFNKAAPPARFAGELLKASGYKPFNVSDQVVRMFMPMITEDMIELFKDDPDNAWMLGPDALGVGVQTFSNERPNKKGTLLGYPEPWVIK